jgi:hypothetical protein
MATTLKPGAKATAPQAEDKGGAHIGGPPGAPDVRCPTRPEPVPANEPAPEADEGS